MADGDWNPRVDGKYNFLCPRKRVRASFRSCEYCKDREEGTYGETVCGWRKKLMMAKPKWLRKAKSHKPWAYEKTITPEPCKSLTIWMYNFEVDLNDPNFTAKNVEQARAWIDSIMKKPDWARHEEAK